MTRDKKDELIDALNRILEIERELIAAVESVVELVVAEVE